MATQVGAFQKNAFQPNAFQVEIRGGMTPRFDGTPPWRTQGEQEPQTLGRLGSGDTPD